jgi:hypothetical protein
MEALDAVAPSLRPGRGFKANDGNASGSRQKTLAGVGHENADADHAKQCCNYLDHHDVPLGSAQTKRHRGPNSQKKSPGPHSIADRLMISSNRQCRKDGEPLARVATFRRKIRER